MISVMMLSCHASRRDIRRLSAREALSLSTALLSRNGENRAFAGLPHLSEFCASDKALRVRYCLGC
ncbi:hypothetical protein EMIT0P218_10571 [Pseudomonas sp. IT-P218]